MSREILFKAKRANWRELPKEEWWIEGFYVKCRGHHYILPVYDADHGYDERYAEWVEVDPKTACQYTGLTNKNGRRYEGDIFQADNGECTQIYIIVWDKHCLEWYAECVGDPDGNLPLCEFRVDEIEVIGNIFDNLDLLSRAAVGNPITYKEEGK